MVDILSINMHNIGAKLYLLVDILYAGKHIVTG